MDAFGLYWVPLFCINFSYNFYIISTCTAAIPWGSHRWPHKIQDTGGSREGLQTAFDEELHSIIAFTYLQIHIIFIYIYNIYLHCILYYCILFCILKNSFASKRRQKHEAGRHSKSNLRMYINML